MRGSFRDNFALGELVRSKSQNLYLQLAAVKALIALEICEFGRIPAAARLFVARLAKWPKMGLQANLYPIWVRFAASNGGSMLPLWTGGTGRWPRQFRSRSRLR